jgi:hypothetical protein
MPEMMWGEEEYKWGYRVEDLDRAVEETRKILVSVAQKESTITYTELCERIQAIDLDPHSYALANILGRVSAAEDVRGSGMLSVLVVYKGDSDKRPAYGFFNLAREQGYQLPDKESEDDLWASQLKKVYDEHSRRRRFKRRRS